MRRGIFSGRRGGISHRHWMAMVFCFLLGACLVVGLPATGWGTTDNVVNQDSAQYLVDHATASFRNGDYEEAIASFNEAQNIIPIPLNLFNIARCYEEMGDHARTVAAYDAYLEAARAEEIQRVERAKAARAAAAKLAFGQVQILCPDDVQVQFDGHEPGGCPYLVEEAPVGTHKLVLVGPGLAERERTVQVKAGSQIRVVDEPSILENAGGAVSESRLGLMDPWVVGLGAASLVAAVVSTVIVRAGYSERQNVLDQYDLARATGDPAIYHPVALEANERLADAKSKTRGGYMVGGAALGLAVTAAVKYVWTSAK